MKYVYWHEEQSVDTRRWEVKSDKPLTTDEIQQLCIEHNDCIDIYKDKTVEYKGTEYGDDCQLYTYQQEPHYVDISDFDPDHLIAEQIAKQDELKIDNKIYTEEELAKQ